MLALTKKTLTPASVRFIGVIGVQYVDEVDLQRLSAWQHAPKRRRVLELIAILVDGRVVVVVMCEIFVPISSEIVNDEAVIHQVMRHAFCSGKIEVFSFDDADLGLQNRHWRTRSEPAVGQVVLRGNIHAKLCDIDEIRIRTDGCINRRVAAVHVLEWTRGVYIDVEWELACRVKLASLGVTTAIVAF